MPLKVSKLSLGVRLVGGRLGVGRFVLVGVLGLYLERIRRGERGEGLLHWSNVLTDNPTRLRWPRRRSPTEPKQPPSIGRIMLGC